MQGGAGPDGGGGGRTLSGKLLFYCDIVIDSFDNFYEKAKREVPLKNAIHISGLLYQCINEPT